VPDQRPGAALVANIPLNLLQLCRVAGRLHGQAGGVAAAMLQGAAGGAVRRIHGCSRGAITDADGMLWPQV
jgi:hypothetical protein